MPRKRNLGRGITPRKDGRLCGVVPLPNGDRQFVYSHKGEKPEDFANRFDQLRADAQKGLPITPERITLEQYLRQWSEGSKPYREPKTIVNYETCIKRFSDLIGNKRLGKLTSADIQWAYTQLLDRGLAASTVHTTHQVLHAALEQAVKWNLLPRNPADLVTPPSAANREMKTYSEDQIRTLFAATANHRLHALWVLMVTTGLRIGEATGLRWQDIDLAASRITLQSGLQRQYGGIVLLKKLKTSYSRRTIYLASGTVEALREHRKRQIEKQLAYGPGWKNDRDLLFTSRTGGPLDARLAHYHWKRTMTLTGLPYIRPHDLRHTAATTLLRRGVHIKVVSEMLGHSDVSMTLRIYAHVLPAMHQEAVRQLDVLF